MPVAPGRNSIILRPVRVPPRRSGQGWPRPGDPPVTTNGREFARVPGLTPEEGLNKRRCYEIAGMSYRHSGQAAGMR